MEIRKTVLWSILESSRLTDKDSHGYPTSNTELVDSVIDQIKYRVEEYLKETADD